MNPRSSTAAPARAPFAFGAIVCAVNRSPGADEAVSQATRLVGPADELTFVAVCDAPGITRAGLMGLSATTASDAVNAARAAAREDGIEARTLVIRGDVDAALGDAAAYSGLLVLGAHGHAPHGGILLGEVAARAVRDLSVGVLIARGQTDLGFPGMILVGTDGPADCDVVEVAATIAARHDTTVVLGHVRRNGRDLQAALEAQAALVLEITGSEAVIVSVDGDPVTRLLAMAGSIGAGLVVLGDHGRRSVATVSERIAHRAPCSVLVWRSPASYSHLHPRTRSMAMTAPTPQRKVVVGYDGSASARAAVEHAIDRATPDGHLVLVHAYEVPADHIGAAYANPNLEATSMYAASVMDALEEACPRLATVSHERDVLPGHPAEAITRAAEVHGADEIVIGSRGVGRVRAVLGSVAHDVLHRAHCPVTIITERAVEAREVTLSVAAGAA